MILMALLPSFFLFLSSSGPAIFDDKDVDDGLDTSGVSDIGTIGICASSAAITPSGGDVIGSGGTVIGSGGTVTDGEGAVVPSTATSNDGGAGWGEASTDDGTWLGLESAIATDTNVDGMLPAKDEGTDSV